MILLTGTQIEELHKQLVFEEDMKLMPYQDSRGIWTFGIGRNLESPGLSKWEVIKGLREGFHTAEFVNHLWSNDIARVVKELEATTPWADTAPWKVQKVLIYWCFQMGEEEFRKCAPTLDLLHRVVKDLSPMEHVAMRLRNMLWYKQTKDRVDRLIQMLLS